MSSRTVGCNRTFVRHVLYCPFRKAEIADGLNICSDKPKVVSYEWKTCLNKKDLCKYTRIFYGFILVATRKHHFGK